MAGWYGAGDNQTACQACPPGAFTPEVPFESDACVPCAGGWFPDAACPSCTSGAKAPGQTACHFCAVGTYVPSDASSICVACAPGRYADAPGSAMCTPCAPGTFSAVRGNNQPCVGRCESALGFFSGGGATACVHCDGGVSPNSSACVGCGLGRYAEDSICKACAPGKVQALTQFANSSTLCVACEGARFASTDGAQCVEAALGYEPIPNRTGQAICRSGTFRGSEQYACTACADGQYSLADGAVACSLCDAGKYRAGKMIACDLCVDAIAATVGAYACDACAPGTMPSDTRTECIDCLPGYYSPNGVGCLPCTGGKVSTPGAYECVDCPDRTTYIGVGQCGQCGPGRYMVRSNVDFRYGCASCPAGTYNPSSGGQNRSACISAPCAPPSYVPNAPYGATGCAPCGPGSASVDGTTCTPCSAGSYGPLGLGCPQCPPGSWSYARGAVQCAPCAAGTWSELGATQCTDCPPGTAGVGCAPCPMGTFMADAGAVECIARKTRCPPQHIVVMHSDRPAEDNGCLECVGCNADQYTLLVTPNMSTWDTFQLLVSSDGTTRVQVPDTACPGDTTFKGYTCIDNHFTPGMYLKGQETTAGISGDNAPINLNVMRCTQLSNGCADSAQRMDYVTGGAFDCFVGCRYGINADAVSAYAQRYGVAPTESLSGNVFLARRAVCFDPPLCAPCPTDACTAPGRYRPTDAYGCGPPCLLEPEQCRDPDTGLANYGCNASCSAPPAHAYYIGGASKGDACPFACEGSLNGLDPGYHLSDDGTRCEMCGVCADPQTVPVEPCNVYSRTAEVCRPCPIVEGGRPLALTTDGRCTYACQLGYYASEDASTCLRCTALNSVACPVGTFRDVAACRPDAPPPCAPCVTPGDLLMDHSPIVSEEDRRAMLTFSSAGRVGEPSSCNATCGAGFHTLRRATGEYVETPLPLMDVRCALCGYTDAVPCHGRCAHGQYRDPAVPRDDMPGACKLCSVSARTCPTGQYAPLCSGNETGDALCRPCAPPPPGRIIVPYVQSEVAVQRGLVSWDGVACPTACANNFAQDAAGNCLPCTGPATACAPAEVPGQPTACDFVYAHWNATDAPIWWTPTTTTPGLPSFRGVAPNRRAGLCYACPVGTGTLSTSTDLCQLLPGFGLAYDPMEVQRVPIPTDPAAVVRSMREPQPFPLTPGRRLLAVVNASTSASPTASLMPVPIGTFNDGASVHPISCPLGMSTRTTGSVSMAQCECMPGYYEAIKGVCVECAANTYRSVNMPRDRCVACPGNETTYGRTAQSACACVAGWMRGSKGCSPCAADRFCRPCYQGQADCPSNLGVWVVGCMPGGTAPEGSVSLLNCTCARKGAARLLRPGYTLDAISSARTPSNTGLYCLDPPPNTLYDSATLTLRCLAGWTATYVPGVMPPVLQGCTLCGRGRVSPSGAASDCRPCPLGTFMDRPDAIGECVPCGANLTTLSVGATSPDLCACPPGTRRDANTKRCDGCALGQYATPDRKGCLPCPEGSTSLVGASNASDCVCLPGTARVKDGAKCAPCPVGTFGAHAGLATCTPCGANRITATTGAVSSSACFCAPGFTTISGVLCVNSSSLLLL